MGLNFTDNWQSPTPVNTVYWTAETSMVHHEMFAALKAMGHILWSFKVQVWSNVQTLKPENSPFRTYFDNSNTDSQKYG